MVICLSLSSIGIFAGSKSIYNKGWIDFNKNGRMDVYENPKAPLESRVRDLLSQMTIEEKTCQLVTLYGSGRVLQDTAPTHHNGNRRSGRTASPTSTSRPMAWGRWGHGCPIPI